MADDQEEEDPCGICLEHMPAALACTLRYGCGHRFHSHCAVNWALTRQSTCPLCRAQVFDHTQALRAPRPAQSWLFLTLDWLRLLGWGALAATATGLSAVTLALTAQVRMLETLSRTVLAAVLWACLLAWLFALHQAPMTLRVSGHVCALAPLFDRQLAGLLEGLVAHDTTGDVAATLVLALARALVAAALVVVRALRWNETLCA